MSSIEQSRCSSCDQITVIEHKEALLCGGCLRVLRGPALRSNRRIADADLGDAATNAFLADDAARQAKRARQAAPALADEDDSSSRMVSHSFPNGFLPFSPPPGVMTGRGPLFRRKLASQPAPRYSRTCQQYEADVKHAREMKEAYARGEGGEVGDGDEGDEGDEGGDGGEGGEGGDGDEGDSDCERPQGPCGLTTMPPLESLC